MKIFPTQDKRTKKKVVEIIFDTFEGEKIENISSRNLRSFMFTLFTIVLFRKLLLLLLLLSKQQTNLFFSRNTYFFKIICLVTVVTALVLLTGDPGSNPGAGAIICQRGFGCFLCPLSREDHE
uniref:Uncharacterized protein n=1 Tax=Cacopsylla melanoneura TaxID=428564 RepID=A0A8D8TJY2_9HEMI